MADGESQLWGKRIPLEPEIGEEPSTEEQDDE
jgi:hypothetical protein